MELIIVIAVIGIMSAFFINNQGSASKKARDAQRRSDMKQYQSALEVFANKKNGFYPSRGLETGQPAATVLCSDLALTNCPQDPLYAKDASFFYRYQSNGSGQANLDATIYVLWDKLETTTDYLVICSNGKTGTKPQTGWVNPAGGVCPL